MRLSLTVLPSKPPFWADKDHNKLIACCR
jgi:hypothetical protein